LPIRLLNSLGLWGVSLTLLVAFYYQLILGEPPCPLCLLQGACFIALGLAFMLDLQFGSSPVHYAMMLVSALLGAGTAMRQILLHIAPGDPGYGSALLGMHFSRWAFVGFSLSILYVGLLLVAEAATDRDHRRIDLPGTVGRLAIWLFALLESRLDLAGVRLGRLPRQPDELRTASPLSVTRSFSQAT
jgi:disulfide bond formation protein DsbB